MLRVILDSHPHIACGPETKILPEICKFWFEFQKNFAGVLQESHVELDDINRSFSKLISSILDKNRVATNKIRFAEKTPGNLRYFDHLHYLFPDSPLIHVIRDGRDVVCSLLETEWFSDPAKKERLPCTVDPREAALHWHTAMLASKLLTEEVPFSDRYLEINYEDLVLHSERTSKMLFEFLEEPWDPMVLQYYEKERNLAGESSADQVRKPLYSSSIGRWKRDMSEVNKKIFKEVAGNMLIEFGYATDMDW